MFWQRLRGRTNSPSQKKMRSKQSEIRAGKEGGSGGVRASGEWSIFQLKVNFFAAVLCFASSFHHGLTHGKVVFSKLG